ncbi:hypothetical protein MsAg5_11500 [Methanosarcinaceae archaeon Ag5]|uniref:Uncharacterized protein n=2 Tax=Methanolapillus africanus TaxID=3028297 RepID=A0AAE4MIN7_9EURY|nr:hypothetical protein [Methanosarcinaceae archaeon Ag5]
MNNVPLIKVKISEIDIQIRPVFGISSVEVLFECHRRGENYRSSFSKAVFHMYEQTKYFNEIILTEDDFVNTTDENLSYILNRILEHDEEIKMEYDKEYIENSYERFYKANEEVLKRATEGIKNPLVEMIKTYESLNKPYMEWLNNVTRLVSTPRDYLLGFNVAIENNSTFDFLKAHPALINTHQFQTQNIKMLHPFFEENGYSPLHKMMENIHLINESVNQLFQNYIVQMERTIQYPIFTYLPLFFHKEWSEQRKTLLNFGWFYSDELPNELVNEIHEKRNELNIDEVNKMIVEYFRKDRCEILKNMVRGWKDLSYFRCRENIFHEALVNHSRKYFNSSVTLLTIHTEGVITDFVRIELQAAKYKMILAIDDIKKLIEVENISVNKYEIYIDVIEQITKGFIEKFDHSNPEEASNKSRHKIAHGHVYEKESEVNSLKQFLYINEIYHLFVQLNKSEQIKNC